MTPKDQFRYSVLSAIHVAGKDAGIDRLRARSAKFEQLLSEALRQGWLDESKTSPSWLQEARCGREVSKRAGKFR